MRILHVIDDLQLGGAERNFISVLPQLKSHDHHVVYLLANGAYANALRSQGIPVEALPGYAVAQAPATIARLRILAGRVDVVHTQRWVSDLLGRVAAMGKTPIVTTVQTSPYEPAVLRGYGPRGRVFNLALRTADVALTRFAAQRVVACSDYVRDVVVERLHVRRDRTRRVYNSISLDDFPPTTPERRRAARALLGLSSKDEVIASLGHIVPLKGQTLLVEAMPSILAQRPHAHLVLIGDGAEERALRGRAAELGIEERVRFLGRRNDVAQLLPAFDVVALASYVEGMPLSILEAMSSGLACVLSPIPPHRELAALFGGAHAERMLVAMQRADAWSERLVGALSDPAFREAVGQLGTTLCRRHFDAVVTAPQLEEVFREAVQEFRSDRKLQ